MIVVKSDVVSSRVGRPGELVFKVKIIEGTPNSYRRFTANGDSCSIRLEGGYFSDDTQEKVVSSSSVLTFKDENKEFLLFIDSFSLSEIQFSIFGSNAVEFISGKFQVSRLVVDSMFGHNKTAFDVRKFVNLKNVSRLVCSSGDADAPNDSILFSLELLLPYMENDQRIDFRNQRFVYGNISSIQKSSCAEILLRNVSVIGDIANAVSEYLTQLNISYTKGIYGNIEDFFVNNIAQERTSIAITWGGSSTYPIRWHGTHGGGVPHSFTAVYNGDNISVSEGGSVIGTYDGTSWTYN